MNILVVDDNEDSQVLVRTILESQGHFVETSENGYEALKKAHSWRPGLIISDIIRVLKSNQQKYKNSI